MAEAQAWMSSQLGDTQYDACVKDFARCSFAVPREYVLWVDEEGLFAENAPSPVIHSPQPVIQSSRPVIQSEAKNLNASTNTSTSGIQILRRSAPLNDNTYPETYEEIPYESIVEVLEEQMGGQPEHGSRNNFIFSMACHLRYVCNDDATWISQILPTYGESKDKWLGSIKSACNRNQTKSMPRIMKRTLAI